MKYEDIKISIYKKTYFNKIFDERFMFLLMNYMSKKSIMLC